MHSSGPDTDAERPPQETDGGAVDPSDDGRSLRTLATTTAGLILAVTVLGLVLRLAFLGDRIAHWDEARVGYWITYYAETGSFAYRRIIHGPFVQHVNGWLFPLVGASDFTMRLPVALISATLPLSALLFREHLRRVELLAMALFLAVNPVVLYYSRFMRSDLLVATFMFFALGALVRFYDTRRWRYVYAAGALMACGFASKENAILYVLTWLGAVGLLADQALYRPRNDASGAGLLLAKLRALAGRVRGGAPTAANGGSPSERSPGWRSRGGRILLHLVGVATVFLALSLFFYAPRGAGVAGLYHPPGTTEQVMFWQAVGDPAQLPTLLEETWAHVRFEYGEWFGQAGESGEESIVSTYVEYLGRFVRVMGLKAAPLTVLSVVGFAAERYGRAESRNLVMLAGYCGFVSVLGYPLGTDIFGAWLVVHALVPLSIPAAVGLARIVDWARGAFAADDTVGLATAAAVLLLVGGATAGVVTNSVYLDDQSENNYLVQYAQPGDSPRAELEAIDRAADDDRRGPDVLLFYGEEGDRWADDEALVERDRAGWNRSKFNYRPLCSKWFNALPLPWYFATSDADVDCARTPGNVTDRLDDRPPAVVVTVASDRTTPETALDDAYSRETYEMRAYGTRMVFWVHEDVERDRSVRQRLSGSVGTPRT